MLSQFFQNGYLVIPDFISRETCSELRTQATTLLNAFEPGEIKTIFSTQTDRQGRGRYFSESANKISFFFEEEAFLPDGSLKQPKELSINKIGHALHHLDPIFSKFSYQPKLMELVHALGLTDPELMQSMYIFKQPRIGGEVTCHQDGTFLFTEPDTTIGFWFALENATRENGCLWAIPGKHETPLKSRFFGSKDGNTRMQIDDSSPWNLDKMVPLEVTEGSLIVLHSRLPHMSYSNRSEKSRHAYTLHFVDKKSHYPETNWLQKN